MTLVLDSGALVALERNDRAMWRRLKATYLAGGAPISHGGIIGQVWRGRGPRQALLAKALAAIEVRPLDERLGRAAGELLAVTRQSDAYSTLEVVLGQTTARQQRLLWGVDEGRRDVKRRRFEKHVQQ